MKILTTILLSLLPLIAAAQTKPQLRWLETAHDFGAFDEDSVSVTCQFAAVNDGPGDVAVLSTRSTCGCTEPKFNKSRIPVGDTLLISVTYNAQGRPGRFCKQVYVETNAETRKSRLDVSGVVIGSEATISQRFPLKSGPLRLAHRTIMLGDVTKGRLKTVYVDGYNRSTDSIRVAVTNLPEWLEVSPTPTVSAPGEQVTLIAYVNTAKCPLYGLVEDSITVIPAAGESCTIPVTMMVKEDFSSLDAKALADAPVAVINPTTIDLGKISHDGEPMHRSFSISNAGKKNLEIRRVYTGDKGIDFKVKNKTVKKGKKADIELTIDPTVQTGALLNAIVTIITNDPHHPFSTIRVVGEWQ